MPKTRFLVIGAALLQLSLGVSRAGAQDRRTDLAMLNNQAWAVFERSSNQDSLRAAITVMEGVVQELADHEESFVVMDTYANLLYKVGRVDEAIQWQEKAVASALKRAATLKNGDENEQAAAKWLETEFGKTLAKMKAGEPTWPQPAGGSDVGTSADPTNKKQ